MANESPNPTTEINLWDYLVRDLQRPLSPSTPNILLHLGAQVDVRNAYDNSRLLIDRFRMSNPPPLKLPPHVRDEIRELFRVAYRVAWSKIPNVKTVLANISNIMVCGITDVVGTLVRHSQVPSERANERRASEAVQTPAGATTLAFEHPVGGTLCRDTVV